MALNDIISYVRFITFLLPIIIPMMALFDSVFNANFKGFLYILGLLLSMSTAHIIAPLLSQIKSDKIQNIPDICNIFNIGNWGTTYKRPGTHAIMLAYTFSYLLLPMIVNSTMNGYLIATLFLSMVINAFITNNVGCTDPYGIVFGWLVGGILGASWYLFLNHVGGSQELTYFSSQKSDKQQCSYKNKTFKCSTSKPAN